MKLANIFKKKPRVNVIRLNGVIGTGSRIGGAGLNDASLAPVIEKAFKGKPVAVALVVNSPGGSPAQSSLIAARIRRLADKENVPVIAFCEDVAASGGYWLACAADEIFADENSVVGSIGVISAGFGFEDFIARHGVSRRVYTAGESKSMLDPFQPEDPDDIARLKDLQSVIHQNFIAQVQSRRDGRLTGENLFTGQVWVGAQAQERGLIDGIGHLVPTLQDRYGDKVRFNNCSTRKPLLGRLGAGTLTHEAFEGLEAQSLWSRFGR